jgi:hypothetical protein
VTPGDRDSLYEDERELLAELSAERLIPLIGGRAAQRVSADCTNYSVERQSRWLRRTWSNWAHPLDGMPIGDDVAGVCAATRRGAAGPCASRCDLSRNARPSRYALLEVYVPP